MNPMLFAVLTWRCLIRLPCPRYVFYEPSIWESLSEAHLYSFMVLTLVDKGNDGPSGSKET